MLGRFEARSRAKRMSQHRKAREKLLPCDGHAVAEGRNGRVGTLRDGLWRRAPFAIAIARILHQQEPRPRALVESQEIGPRQCTRRVSSVDQPNGLGDCRRRRLLAWIIRLPSNHPVRFLRSLARFKRQPDQALFQECVDDTWLITGRVVDKEVLEEEDEQPESNEYPDRDFDEGKDHTPERIRR